MFFRIRSFVAVVAFFAVADASFVRIASSKTKASSTSLHQQVLRQSLSTSTPLVVGVIDEWKKSDDAANLKKMRYDLTLTRPTKAFLKLAVAITVATAVSLPDLHVAEHIVDATNNLGELRPEQFTQFFSAGNDDVQRLFQSGRETTIQASAVAREVISANFGRLQSTLEATKAMQLEKIGELHSACVSGAADCEAVAKHQWETANVAWSAQVAMNQAKLAAYQAATDDYLVHTVPTLWASLSMNLVQQQTGFQMMLAMWEHQIDAVWNEQVLANIQVWSDVVLAKVGEFTNSNNVMFKDVDMSIPASSTQVLADAGNVMNFGADTSSVASSVSVEEAARVWVASARTVSETYDELVRKLYLSGAI